MTFLLRLRNHHLDRILQLGDIQKTVFARDPGFPQMPSGSKTIVDVSEGGLPAFKCRQEVYMVKEDEE